MASFVAGAFVVAGSYMYHKYLKPIVDTFEGAGDQHQLSANLSRRRVSKSETNEARHGNIVNKTNAVTRKTMLKESKEETLSAATLRLLQNMKCFDKLPTENCQIKIDRETSKVEFLGPADEVADLMNKLKEMSSQIIETSKQLTMGLATAYKLPGVQKFLQKHCKNIDCVDVLNDDDTFTVASNEDGGVEKHMQSILDQLDVWAISIPEMPIDTVISEMLKELGAFEPDDTVAIETNPEHDIVQISGIKTEVKKTVEQIWAVLSKLGIEKKTSYNTDCLTLRFRQEFGEENRVNPGDDDVEQKQYHPFTVEIPETITSTDTWGSHQNNEEFKILVYNLEESFQCPLELVEQPIPEPKGVELISPIALLIDVKLGDITMEKADILVNVTNKDLKLAVKGVAQDFLEAGGEELQEELSNRWREDLEYGEIIYVPAVGRLKENCKFIANFILPAWADVNSCEVIAESVRGCLTVAKQNGLSSVAFPTIGCGRLKYPMGEVATCLLMTAGEFIQNGSDSLEVKVVVLEQSLFDTFLSASKSIGCIKTQSDGGATKQDLGEDMQAGASASANTESASQRRSKYSLKGVTLPNNVDRTKGNILKVVEDEFYAEAIDLKSYPEDKVQKFIGTSKNFLKSLGVQAKADLINSKLQLSGKRERVTLALKEVSKKITNTNTDECPLPEYWPQSGKNFVCLPLDQQSPLYNTIKKLVHGTWQAKYTGYGRDSEGIKRSSRIQVKKVEVNINRELYALYWNRRRTLLRSYKSSGYYKFDAYSDVKPVLTADYLTEVLVDILNPKLNEFYLLHGTKQEAVKPICTQGFDFRVGNDGGMLGKGIYFGESSSKADQYADTRRRRGNGKDLKMILTRVCMGCIFLCSNDNPTKFSRPPCTTCFQDICTHNHDFYDSVVYANPNKNFREFIIYERHQSYPEFIITYDRVAGN